MFNTRSVSCLTLHGFSLLMFVLLLNRHRAARAGTVARKAVDQPLVDLWLVQVALRLLRALVTLLAVI